MTSSTPDHAGPSAITHVGHVGLYTDDLPRMVDFFTRVLDFTVTDGSPEQGIVFLSTRPQLEHHMLALLPGRQVPDGTKLLQQLSFNVESLDDLLRYRDALLEYGTTLDLEVTHGNAIGIYFWDPEGNRLELYWKTGIDAPQPLVQHLDLTASTDDIMAQVREAVSGAVAGAPLQVPGR